MNIALSNFNKTQDLIDKHQPDIKFLFEYSTNNEIKEQILSLLTNTQITESKFLTILMILFINYNKNTILNYSFNKFKELINNIILNIKDTELSINLLINLNNLFLYRLLNDYSTFNNFFLSFIQIIFNSLRLKAEMVIEHIINLSDFINQIDTNFITDIDSSLIKDKLKEIINLRENGILNSNEEICNLKIIHEIMDRQINKMKKEDLKEEREDIEKLIEFYENHQMIDYENKIKIMVHMRVQLISLHEEIYIKVSPSSYHIIKYSQLSENIKKIYPDFKYKIKSFDKNKFEE